VCQFTSVSSRWILSSTKRIHSHDVRALSIFPPYTPHVIADPYIVPTLASGGWDMSLTLTPASTASDVLIADKDRVNPLAKKDRGASRVLFDESFPRKMSYWRGGRGTSYTSVSRMGRLVVARKERSVGIWRVLDDEAGWEKLLDMDLRVGQESNIRC
jgi:U3 small nucleolar RNA-associated protein 4